MHEATLSNADGFTAFSFGGYNIRFKAPYSLERYTDVVKWEDGYLVVKAKYRHNAEPEEEYIDLKPILDGLYIDYDSFLKPIKSVRITDTKVVFEESQAGLNSAKLKTIADKADIIVNGYAFTRNDERIQVLNLNCPEKAVVFSTDGEVLETTMDDIELSIASCYLQQNKKYMEE